MLPAAVLLAPLAGLALLLLLVLLRVRRRRCWRPRACQVDLRGKTALVTGANSGESSRRAAAAGGLRERRVSDPTGRRWAGRPLQEAASLGVEHRIQEGLLARQTPSPLDGTGGCGGLPPPGKEKGPGRGPGRG